MPIIFCPVDKFLLNFEKDSHKKLAYLKCSNPDCFFEHEISEQIVQTFHKIEIHGNDKEKTGFVLSDEDNFRGTAETEEICPKCAHNRAHVMQMQTRSADEPMTTKYSCQKCRHIWTNYSDAFIVDGEADESEDEKVSISELTNDQQIINPVYVKFDNENNTVKNICNKSLFHSNLNSDMKSFIQNLRKFTDILYNQTKLSINMMQTQLMATYSLIQNVSYNLRISSNDLFYLEDHVDLICELSDNFPKFFVN